MDILDQAQEAEEFFRRKAVAKHLKKEVPNSSSRTHCLDCGKPIPAARRERVPGCLRCVRCQQVYEVAR